MIVYNESSYSFVNYKDQVNELTTLYKVNKITIENVNSPDLGTDYVIIWQSGNTSTSGSPKPGGKIYLQNEYVAIVYDNSRVFEIVYSKGYRYNEKFLQVKPNAHMSTPMARALLKIPRQLAFVNGGSLAVYDDALLDGLDADYIAIDDGDVLAAFDVKEQVYYGLPFPIGLNHVDLCALGNSFKEQNMYQVGPSVQGLMKNATLDTHIQSLRNAMYNYQRLDIDYTIATSYAKPVSSAFNENGVVNSALTLTCARQYLKDKELSGEPLTDLLYGFVMNNDVFDNILKRGINADDILQYIYTDTLCHVDTIVLLNSEFQEILNYYNLMYNKNKEDAAVAALKRLQADLTSLESVVNKYIDIDSKAIIENDFKSRPGYSGIHITNEARFSIAIPDLKVLNEMGIVSTPDGSNASLYTSTAASLIGKFAHDSILTSEDIDNAAAGGEAGNFNLPFINLDIIGADRFNSYQYAKAYAALCDVIQAKLDSIPKIAAEFDSNYTQSQEHDRWNNPFTKGITIRCFPDKLIFSARSLTIRQDGIYVDAKIRIPKYDAWLTYYKGQWEQALKNDTRNVFSEIGFQEINFAGFNYDVGAGKGVAYGICNGWDASKEFIQGNVCFKKCEIDMNFSMKIPLSFQTQNVPIKDQMETIPSVFKFDSAAKLAKAEVLKTKFPDAVAKFAAAAAYEICKPLFQNCKDNYEYIAIGSQGATYDGVAVAMSDLAKICAIDESYINTLTTLIDEIPDKTLRDALNSFRSSLQSVKAAWKSTNPVYYLTRADLAKAVPVTDTNAIIHYLFGGI